MKAFSLRVSLLVLSSTMVGASFEAKADQFANPWAASALSPDVVGGDVIWGQAVTAQGDFFRWLGSMRLNEARANLIEARAAQEYQRAAALNRTVRALELDLSRVNSYIRDLNNGADSVENHYRRLNGLTHGYISAATLSSIGNLLNLVPQEVIDQLLAESALIPALNASDFVLNTTYRTTYDKVTKTYSREDIVFNNFAGGNIFAFIEWLKSPRVKMKAIPGSASHTFILQLRGVLKNAGEMWLNNVYEKRTAYEDRNYNIWSSVYGAGTGLPARELP